MKCKSVASIVGITLMYLIFAPSGASAEPGLGDRECRFASANGVPGYQRSDVELVIRCAADRFNVSVSTALYVAERESGLGTDQLNESSGACGVYQHIPRYWDGRLATYRRHHRRMDIRSDSCFGKRGNVLVSLWMARQGWAPWGL
jgi:hypothetical protein